MVIMGMPLNERAQAHYTFYSYPYSCSHINQASYTLSSAILLNFFFCLHRRLLTSQTSPLKVEETEIKKKRLTKMSLHLDSSQSEGMGLSF